VFPGQANERYVRFDNVLLNIKSRVVPNFRERRSGFRSGDAGAVDRCI
jgi:hypothetical protein